MNLGEQLMSEASGSCLLKQTSVYVSRCLLRLQIVNDFSVKYVKTPMLILREYQTILEWVSCNLQTMIDIWIFYH